MYLPNLTHKYLVFLFIRKDSETFRTYSKKLFQKDGRFLLSGYMWPVTVKENEISSNIENIDGNTTPFILKENSTMFLEKGNSKDCLQYVETIPMSDIDSYEVVMNRP